MTSANELRQALLTIHNKYKAARGNTHPVKGVAFKQAVDFTLATAIGHKLCDESRPFDFDITPLVAADKGEGLLQAEQVATNWDHTLGNPLPYWTAVWAAQDTPPDSTPGTNICEAFHSELRRLPALMGRKNFAAARMWTDMVVTLWNYSILSSELKPAQTASHEQYTAPTLSDALKAGQRSRLTGNTDWSMKKATQYYTDNIKRGRDAYLGEWKRIYYALMEFTPEDTTYQGLQDQGYLLRQAAASDPTGSEKQKITDALQQLAGSGPTCPPPPG